jgi:hypothetical protein
MRTDGRQKLIVYEKIFALLDLQILFRFQTSSLSLGLLADDTRTHLP